MRAEANATRYVPNRRPNDCFQLLFPGEAKSAEKPLPGFLGKSDRSHQPRWAVVADSIAVAVQYSD
jgi:hypothetical protein